MREIEIKVVIHDAASLQAALTAHGISLSAPKKQHDVVYGQKDANGNFIHGSNWLRIRTEDDATVYLTLKRQAGAGLDSIEHETVVADAGEATAIVTALGYERYSDLTKERRKARYQDIEICLDEVPGLGTFIEAEKLCADDVDGQAVKHKLWDLLASLGLSPADEVTSGYDVLLREKQGLER